MSGHGFTADTDALVRRAGAFAGLSERAGGIVDSLTETLGSYGDCWGSDAAGEAFARSHVEPAGTALDGIGRLPAGLSAIGVRLRDSASTYVESEVAGIDTVRAAGTELG